MTWKKGQSGNPEGRRVEMVKRERGRPKQFGDIREIARRHAPQAIKTLVDIMKNPKASTTSRVTAAQALLDRGYGKAPQHLEHTGKDGAPLYSFLTSLAAEDEREQAQERQGETLQ